jgi:flagellar biosynthesis/type III secretory pathway chaperone
MLQEALIVVLDKEFTALQELLKLMEEQHHLLVKNDIFGLEAIIERIQLCNKSIAQIEVERRKLVKEESIIDIINSTDSEELDKSYRSIQKLLFEVTLQKDTNEMLIKQGLGFSSKMLNLINPDRNMKTYNSYGKVSR